MVKFRNLAAACALSALALSAVTAPGARAETPPPAKPASGETSGPRVGQAGKDVIWLPTAQALVDRMLEMASVTADDHVIDLGSGDGRTVITAARLGARAHGIEFDPDLVALSRKNAEAAGVGERATFEQADIFESDFSQATVITLFLLPNLNVKLRPTLLDMKPGTRVVSNSFDMGDWEPDNQIEAAGECTSYCTAYLWIIPAKVDGTWTVDGGELALSQTFQILSGTLTRDGETLQIADGKLDGRAIAFTAGDSRYTGEVGEDGRITGAIEGGGSWTATRAAAPAPAPAAK